MKKLLLIPLLLIFAVPAFAQRQDPFIYNKTVIKIVPKSTTQTIEPGGKPTDPTNMMPTLKRVPKEFTVDVRSPSFLTQRDFISLQPFTDKEGMLILVDPPAEAQVKATRMISVADVLFIDQDGVIVKIAPSLKLSGLSETIDSGQPIHAFIYLKAGTTVSSDIQIGDKVENGYFKTHPMIIQ